MLTQAHRQEALTRAYLLAVAGRCGLLTSTRDFDYGLDMTFHLVRQVDRRYFETGVKLDIQARSCIAPPRTDSEVLYNLEVRTYDLLRENPVSNPRILVLLALPGAEADWLEVTEQNLLLRDCAYWVSLRGEPPTPNRSTIRISIPRRNLLSVEGVNDLMSRVQRQEPLQ